MTFLSKPLVNVNGPLERLVLIGDRGPGHGRLEVLLDGKRMAVVDTGSRTTRVRQHLWTGITRTGRHVLRVRVLDTAKRATVAIDGLAVLGS